MPQGPGPIWWETRTQKQEVSEGSTQDLREIPPLETNDRPSMHSPVPIIVRSLLLLPRPRRYHKQSSAQFIHYHLLTTAPSNAVVDEANLDIMGHLYPTY